MRASIAIFQKQLKDTFKNKTILIQFILYPALAFIMENAMNIENMPKGFFTKLFAIIFIGMTPLMSMASIISEEKETHTLKALLMSNVKPAAYLFGLGVYILFLCLLGAVFFYIGSPYSLEEGLQFIAVMMVGVVVSMVVGAAIGIISKNQMMATSITMPIMMILAFLPMLANFNEKIEKVARITYSQQLNAMIADIGKLSISVENVTVIAINALLAVILFIVAYNRCGLES